MPRVLFVFGTRPEAIKLAPVIGAMRDLPDTEVRVAVTAQHREMLDQVLEAFRVRTDYDLDLMRPGQSLLATASRILSGLEPILADEKPDWVLVQGDTTTAFCGAFAGFSQHIRVAHVEAGLRTGDPQQPFPEEMNRVLVGRLADVHFAPTSGAAENLRAELVPEDRIQVTGNTGIDAVLQIRDALESGRLKGGELPPVDSQRKRIVVTAHRRESFGEPMVRIAQAIAQLARRTDVDVVFPVHLNPQVRKPIHEILGASPNVHLIEPLSYVPFVDLMRQAYLLLTDSGGIQEEAPSLGVPVLVLREKTERPEAVEAGTAELVGADPGKIVERAAALLDHPGEHQRRSRIHNPFGDGRASARIAEFLRIST